MASKNINEEKPNLRPTKFLDASGKSLGTCYCLRRSWGDSYIYATWNNPTNNYKKISFNKPGLFGIEKPHIEYSLNKQQRWKLFDDFRRNIVYSSDSSSDDELSIQSQSKQRRKNHSKTTTESHQDQQDTNYVEIISFPSERYRKLPKKSLSQRRIVRITESGQHSEDHDEDPRAEKVAADITYTAVISSRKKQIPSIRTNHGRNDKKWSMRPENKKFSLMKEQSNDEPEEVSSDDDEFLDLSSTSPKLSSLQLNDFLPLDTDQSSFGQPDNSTATTNKFDPKSAHKYWGEMTFDDPKNRFYRQKSREEKLYHRDMTTYLKQQSDQGQRVQLKTKSPHHLMSLSFRSITLDKAEFTREYLSKTYGKNFIHAQCHPTKYLFCLTDRLKSSSWSNKFDFFSIYSTLNCYLILILNEQTKIEENICHGQVGLNIDLYTETLELNNLSTSAETIYGIEELIKKGIEFVTALPFETFKPIDYEITQRKLVKDPTDHVLSDSEFFNKQIRQVHLLNTSDLQTQLTLKEEEESSEPAWTRPKICTNCCEDMNDFTPMTALKTCGHWLCNDCWKKYLENCVKCVKLIVCPEWHCSSVVDAGTILSLVNVRCLNIYERHIEKCLVNLSRSYVRCPLTSCSNIIQIIGSSALDYVRCRCGHQFCLDCKEEPHFPATCRSYRAYIDKAKRNRDLDSDLNAKTIVIGRKCISCNNFIEKNGGCNHMTCRCGAEFCWICVAYWKEHHMSSGIWKCPRGPIEVEKRVLVHDVNPSKHLYAGAIYHRRQRTFEVQSKLKENAGRLIATIPLDKDALLDSTLIKIQLEKRQALLEHCYQMVKYIDYLHRICEFIAVAADGYTNNPKEVINSVYRFESVIFQLIAIFDNGRGYSAIEQLNELYQRSEKLIERLRRAARLRRLHQLNTDGYVTS